MPVNPLNPLVVQSDRTVLLEVDNPQIRRSARCAGALRRAGKKPGTHPHLPAIAAFPVERGRQRPDRRRHPRHAWRNTANTTCPATSRWMCATTSAGSAGSSCARDATGGLLLVTEDPLLMLEVSRQRKVKQFILEEIDACTVRVNPAMRGHVKKALVDVGYPGRRPGRLRGGRGAAAATAARPARHRRSLRAAPLSAGRRGHLPRRRLGRRAAPASSCCPAARARRWSAWAR